VPVYASGATIYSALAEHGLYLDNQETGISLTVGGSVALETTRLLGGDADNNSTIGLGDLTCIGGSFGGAPVVCGTTGSSDINHDGTVNIFDLVLPGGNYGLSSPQVW
jgi:hypothetical protein